MGALLPVEAPGDPRALIEQIVDMVGMRVSAARAAHHREGFELFTVHSVLKMTLDYAADANRLIGRNPASRTKFPPMRPTRPRCAISGATSSPATICAARSPNW